MRVDLLHQLGHVAQIEARHPRGGAGAGEDELAALAFSMAASTSRLLGSIGIPTAWARVALRQSRSAKALNRRQIIGRSMG